MTSASIAVVAVVAVLTLCAGTAEAAHRTDAARIMRTIVCEDRDPDGGACTSLAKQDEHFCIAEDRCSTVVPRPASALIRYDAKMDALTQR